MENYDTLLGSIAYLYGHDKDKENVKEQLQEGVKNLMALFDS
jgi:hypothetical protein